MGRIELYDTNKDIYQRKDISKYTGKNIVELHMNSFSDSIANGVEVIIYESFNPDNLDNELLSVLSKYFKNRGMKRRNDLYNCNICANNDIPYRLLEMGFISNKEDLNTFLVNMDSIASDLYKVISKYDNILLICGHGEGDPGAVVSGYSESRLVRKLAFKIMAIQDGSSKLDRKYQIGDKVRFSTCYRSSTDTIEKHILARDMVRNYGVISRIVEDANNPYLLDDGMCWVNDGDIREVL